MELLILFTVTLLSTGEVEVPISGNVEKRVAIVHVQYWICKVAASIGLFRDLYQWILTWWVQEHWTNRERKWTRKCQKLWFFVFFKDQNEGYEKERKKETYRENLQSWECDTWTNRCRLVDLLKWVFPKNPNLQPCTGSSKLWFELTQGTGKPTRSSIRYF